MAAQWVGQLSHRISMLAVAAQGVVTVKKHPTHIILAEFANTLGEFASSLKELQKELEVVSNSCSIESQQRDMEAELMAVEQLVMAQKAQSKLLSLLSCPFLLAKLQSCKENLSRDIESIIPEACSAVVKLQIARTQRMLKQSPGPKLGLQEQTVIASLSTITEESTPLKCKDVAVLVAEYLGAAVGDVAFAEQLAEVKRDIGKTEMSHGTKFSTHLESCIKALEKGLGFESLPGAGKDEILSANSPVQGSKEVGANALAPLPSFICPLTKQVMKDPVQIESGQTFEKSTIMQWFKDGKTTSPLVGERLRNTEVTPNNALRQSITEWKERNYNIRLDNAESRLRSFQPMEQARGARDIKILCEEDAINKYNVASRKLIPQLIRLADTPKIPVTLRELCFNALAALALDHQENQETLVFEGVIDVLVRCLRNRDEAEPAINLLKILSGSSNIAEIIGLKPDAVLLLVTFLGHENENLVVSVKAVLVNLPTSDENVVIMAEANLMKPLVTRLVEGGKQAKILMARTLGRLKHMPDSSRCLASTRDTINILINMTNSEDEEEVAAAVPALKNLSTVPSVGVLIADCSGLEVLIRLLSNKQTSVNMSKVGASYIVANVLHAVGNEWPSSEDKDADIDSHIETIFILVSSSTKPPTTSPAVQSHLLQGLLGLVEGKDTGRVVKGIMMRRNAFSILTSHFRDTHLETRRDSLKLFAALSRKHGAEAWSAIKIHSGTLRLLINMLKAEDKISESEKVAAARTIAYLPVEDHDLTVTLRDLEMVPVLVKYLTSSNQAIQEAALGALVRFTSPESLDLQKQLAEMGVIPSFVYFLDSGKYRAKINAAKALANFAKSTPRLVSPVATRTCWQCFAPTPVSCKLHAGLCSVESTFCLLAAEAIDPLLAIVAEPPSGPNKKSAEAALEALYALVENDQDWERGCHVINRAGGVSIILKNLLNCTPRAQEISIDLCERFFKIPQFQSSFGGTAQMLIITVAQNAAIPRTRGVANRVLRQLDLLGSLAGSQSHYLPSSVTSAAGRPRGT